METSFDEENSEKDKEESEGERVAMQVNVFKNSPKELSSVSPLKEQEKKRPRREGDGVDDTTKANLRSALSFEESGRTQ